MTDAVRRALTLRAELHTAAADPSLSFDVLDTVYNRFWTYMRGLTKREQSEFYAEDAARRTAEGWTNSAGGGQSSPPMEEEIEWP